MHSTVIHLRESKITLRSYGDSTGTRSSMPMCGEYPLPSTLFYYPNAFVVPVVVVRTDAKVILLNVYLMITLLSVPVILSV